MTTLPLWQVDAFAAARFKGNPAAVVPLDRWLPDAQLQAIAAENNLAETAFLLRKAPGRWHLRWFTPAVEVKLCGHATLASGYVIDRHLEPGVSPIVFETLSGELKVAREGERYRLDLPSYPVKRVADPARIEAIGKAIGQAPREVWENVMVLVLLADADAVAGARPDIRAIARLPGDGIILTGAGGQAAAGADFVSRYFVPQAGIDEDPVTGSAHCRLAPFWAERLGKTAFFARQVSARGGELWLTLAGERVMLAGEVQPYLEGRIAV